MTAIAVFFFITLPWLNPFSPGPIVQAMPLLFAWVCAAGVLLALAADAQHGQTPRMVRSVALAWLAAAGLSALIGLLQYLGATAAFGVWLNHPDVGQAYGNLRQRNQFATLLGIGLLAVIWLAAQAQNRNPWRSVSFVWIGLAALLGAGNAASSSRTGLLQLMLTVPLTLWWLRGRTKSDKRLVQVVLAAALAAYALASLVLPAWIGLDPFSTGAWARLRAGDAACASRLTLWDNVLHLIAQRPWLGWGWGELDYAHFIMLYPGARFCDILDNAHNLPLHLAVELGIPAALLLCGAALWLVWRGQPWREQHPARQLAWGVLALIGLHSLLEYPLWYGPFQMAAALSVWLLWWLPSHPVASQSYKVFKPIALYLYELSAILIIVFCSLAAWHYRIASQIYLPSAQRANAYRTDTLAKTKNVWFYRDTVRFAELTTADLDADNALQINALAKEMLHFSPEAQVVRLLLDSARLMGRDDEVAFYAARFKAAFPKDYAAWAAEKR